MELPERYLEQRESIRQYILENSYFPYMKITYYPDFYECMIGDEFREYMNIIDFNERHKSYDWIIYSKMAWFSPDMAKKLEQLTKVCPVNFIQRHGLLFFEKYKEAEQGLFVLTLI